MFTCISVAWLILLQAKEHNYVIPVYKVEVGDEFTGATVIEPNKGSVVFAVLKCFCYCILQCFKPLYFQQVWLYSSS